MASRPVRADLDFGGVAKLLNLPGNILAPSVLTDGAAVSVLGRAANSSGARADIAAGSNDTALVRTGNALSFAQITYAMLASSALIASGDFRAATASKLLTAAGVWSEADYKALTDGTNITLDMSLMATMASVALGGNRTLSNPSNTKNGQQFAIKVTASGATRTLSLGGNYTVAAGTEAFPISILTTETVYIYGFIESSTVARITGVERF